MTQPPLWPPKRQICKTGTYVSLTNPDKCKLRRALASIRCPNLHTKTGCSNHQAETTFRCTAQHLLLPQLAPHSITADTDWFTNQAIFQAHTTSDGNTR